MTLARVMTAEGVVLAIDPEEAGIDRAEHIQAVRLLQNLRQRLQQRIDDMREDSRG